MSAAGIDSGQAAGLMPRILERAQEIYEDTAPDLRHCACPGVAGILDEFTRSGVVLALVTGNLTRIGWRKLRRAGLDGYFRFGAFGEMAPSRGALARLAIERARREHLIDAESPIALIGDAPQDVQAARENGIVSIAVRTGVTPPADLESAAPDLMFDDLTQLNPALIAEWRGKTLR
jgi:phosphoglycolate phosphatase